MRFSNDLSACLMLETKSSLKWEKRNKGCIGFSHCLLLFVCEASGAAFSSDKMRVWCHSIRGSFPNDLICTFWGVGRGGGGSKHLMDLKFFGTFLRKCLPELFLHLLWQTGITTLRKVELEERIWGRKMWLPGSCWLTRCCIVGTQFVRLWIWLISLEAYTMNPLRLKEKEGLSLIHCKNTIWVWFQGSQD